MAATIEVKFFNSFWIKKVVPQAAAPTIDTDTSTGSFDSANVSGYWPGLPTSEKSTISGVTEMGTSIPEGVKELGTFGGFISFAESDCILFF